MTGSVAVAGRRKSEGRGGVWDCVVVVVLEGDRVCEKLRLILRKEVGVLKMPEGWEEPVLRGVEGAEGAAVRIVLW